MRIDINVCYKDRPAELGLLIQSLREQTLQDWDLHILDDGSGTLLTTYHFLNVLFNRIKFEGHSVHIIRSEVSKGVSVSRKALADYSREHGRGEFICRLDDDVILAKDYLEKLYLVIKKGYDLASGVTPPMGNPETPRSVRFVEPIINRVVLDKTGAFVVNSDDCGFTYEEDAVLPTHHFRSCALYKKEMHEKAHYECFLTECGFREEEFLSFRMLLAGYKLGVHTGAVAWHLVAGSGGDRRKDYNDKALQNQRILNRWVKEKYAKHGDFIEEYNKRCGINDNEEAKTRNLRKSTNLIFSRAE